MVTNFEEYCKFRRFATIHDPNDKSDNTITTFGNHLVWYLIISCWRPHCGQSGDAIICQNMVMTALFSFLFYYRYVLLTLSHLKGEKLSSRQIKKIIYIFFILIFI